MGFALFWFFGLNVFQVPLFFKDVGKKFDEFQFVLPPGIGLSPLRAEEEIGQGYILVSEPFFPQRHE